MISEFKQEILTESFLQVSTVDDLDLTKVKKILSQNKFVAISGLISPEKVKNALKKIGSKFSKNNDHPTIGESPDDVKTNFQKFSVGSIHSANHSHNYSRLLRTFYNPLWAEDIYSMHSIFRQMIKLRNRLLNKPDNFATTKIDEGFWTAARIHQYPIGGGFMSQHRDKTLSNYLGEINLNYYQLLLIMSKKGIDFEQGGGFIHYGEQRVIFEDEFDLGDIVIYDSQTVHGVQDIDPHKNLDLDNFSGRVAAFVSLYKSL